MFVEKKELENVKDKLGDIMVEESQKTVRAFKEIEAQIDAICKHFNILLWKNSGYEVREFKRPDEVKCQK